MMLTGAKAGTTLVRQNPLALNSRRIGRDQRHAHMADAINDLFL
jgi:hypothetical protein